VREALSIRTKVIIGLTICLSAVVFIGGLSYRYLVAIEKKQHVVGIADDLSNIILEIRRYEKNYLLYASIEDLKENRRYVREATELLDRMLPEISAMAIAPKLSQLVSALRDYSGFMEKRARCNPLAVPTCAALEDQVRESGKRLVDLSELLVQFERDMILRIISTLQNNLIVSLLILVGVGVVFAFFVGTKIVRPLSTIEKTTLRIAEGDFSPIPVIRPRDETQRVILAFNRMISELEKRQEQLVRVKKLSSIGILAAGIAHQLNNPLNNISTSLQIITEEFGQGDPEFARKLLTNCGQEILRAQEIVKGLLEFSRQRDFALRRVALREVVERAVRLVSSQVPPGIEIEADVPPELILELDSQRIQEVLLNLLMNAIQAMENAPGRIRIHAENVDDTPGQPQVEIVVADSGKGIAPEDVGRIFDPFFTTKQVGAGTGLGLSIAYGIIEKHSGRITVESRLGEGTRFIIRLPVSDHGSAQRP
jgi:two-component system NtrC family sensor kinase